MVFMFDFILNLDWHFRTDVFLYNPSILTHVGLIVQSIGVG